MNETKYLQEFCTGCGLCHSTEKMNLKKNGKGYYVPQITHGQYDYYESVCPVFHYQNTEKFDLWGTYVCAYSGFASDNEIRQMASSGGAITAILLYLLENNIVDGIIHTGADRNNPLATETRVSRTEEEILNNMGSRYSISAPLFNLMGMLKDGEKYAFVGKPCDVAALKRYMKNIRDVSDQIVLTISFFCAGMPSDTINKQLVQAMGSSPENLQSFRYRGNGWPGFTTAVGENNEIYQMAYETAWGKYLGRDVNKICRYCMDGIGEFADIACADFWYLKEDNTPDFSEHDGRNIIFCRNLYAEKILSGAVANGYLHVESTETEMQHFQDYQPYQFRRRVTMKYQLLALKMFGRSTPRYNKHMLDKANKYAERQANKDIFIGTVKRILKGRL